MTYNKTLQQVKCGWMILIFKKNTPQRLHRACMTTTIIIIITIKVKPAWPAAQTSPGYEHNIVSLQRPQTGACAFIYHNNSAKTGSCLRL